MMRVGTIPVQYICSPRSRAALYAAPTGSGAGNGSLAQPYDLLTGLAKLPNGGTLLLQDGIYTIDGTSTLQPGRDGATLPTTVRAAPGARPVITTDAGHPPQMIIYGLTTVDGLWFVGSKDAADHYVQHRNDVIIQNCVLAGYYGGINTAAGLRARYTNNRFINCGTGSLYHSIYVNDAAAGPGEGPIIEGNIAIGGQGYHFHLWHEPTYTVIRNNFSGDAQWSLVPNGPGHLIERNVWWSARTVELAYSPINLTEGAGRTYRHNYHGPVPNAFGVTHSGSPDWFNAWSFPADLTSEGNYYQLPARGYADPLQIEVAADGEAALLGATAASIDEAITLLEQAFAQPVADIWADANIEPLFARLKAVLDTWAAA